MEIIVVGMSYQNSPVEMREQVSFSNKELEDAYKQLKALDGIEEIVILDTCNRTEIYAYVQEECGPDLIIDFLMTFHQLEAKWRENFYHYKNKQAVDHLYRVSAGLDSMIVGEDQILGQVKTAYEKAMEGEATGKVLNTLFRDVITGAKKVRSQVMGNNPPLSISSIGVQFIKKNIKDFRQKKVFVLGVGKMSKITVQNLISEGVEDIFVANRTKHKAKQLAKFFPNIHVVPYEERLEVMAQCHITISSTSAPHYVIRKEMFMPFHKGQEMVFVDLSLPRDIEPSLEGQGITIYTLDDLQQVSDQNIEKRKSQAQLAKKALKKESQKFWEWYLCQPIVPTISFLQDYYREIADQEIQSLLGRLGHLDQKDQELIDRVSRSMARKLFNIPILQMKECAKNGDSMAVRQLVEVLFELPVEEKEGASIANNI